MNGQDQQNIKNAIDHLALAQAYIGKVSDQEHKVTAADKLEEVIDKIEDSAIDLVKLLKQ